MIHLMKKDVFQLPINLQKLKDQIECKVKFLDYNGKEKILEAEGLACNLHTT